MKPSHVSRELRRIASKIDGSTNPSSKLVANDLKRVLAAMGGSDSSGVVPGTNYTWSEVERSLVESLKENFEVYAGDATNLSAGCLGDLDAEVGLYFGMQVTDDDNYYGTLVFGIDGDQDFVWQDKIDTLSSESERKKAAEMSVDGAMKMIKRHGY